MSWIPSFTVDGGLFAGQAFPYGSLTGFINEYPNNPRALVNGLYCGNSETTSSWAGSFGAAGDQLLAYGLEHKDNTFHYFDGIILDVKNPEGAQFYKQQLVFEMYVGFSTEMSNTVTISGEQISVTYVNGTFGIRNIWRREYATPYSTPTQTVLAGAARDVVFTYVISGDIRALPRGYSNQIFGKLYVPLAFGTYAGNDTEYFGCGIYLQYTNAAGTGYTKAGYVGVKHETINDVFMIDFEPPVKDDPNDEDPPEDGPGKGGGGGGNGDHTLPNDPVPIPSLPGIGVASVNWLTVYKMTLTQINSFGQAMLDPRGWDALKQFFNNPLEAIVNIMLIPASAPTAGERTPVVGRGEVAYSWPEPYPIIHEEFAEIDCGVIMVKPYWDSAFDFDPYTRIEIFIPFLGFKQIKADDVMGSRVHVKYHVNVMTGEFTVFVSRTAAADDIYGIMAEQVIGEYNGNMGMRVPIGRNSADAAIDASMRLMSNALGISAGAALGAALGDPMNVSASQAGSQIASATMTAVTGPKNHIERSGSLGGGSGYLGSMKPFIVRSIPRQFMPKNYRMLEGYPANIGGTLSHYTGTGYQAVESIQLDGLNAYDSEINEIISILRGGVLV